jgi:hypothetical protein
VGSWDRGFVGSRVRGFVGSWVRGFVGSWISVALAPIITVRKIIVNKMTNNEKYVSLKFNTRHDSWSSFKQTHIWTF